MDDQESVTMSIGGTERNYAGTERGSVLNFPGTQRSSILVRSSMRGSFSNLLLQIGPKSKQRGDAASAAGSRASSYRSRRQSASSQMSFSSRSGMRPHRRARKKKAAENADIEDIRVIDENGVDVTPKPLVSLKPTVLHEKLLQASPGHVSPAEFERDKSSSLYSGSRYSRRSSVASLTPETLDGDEATEKDDVDKRAASVKGHPMSRTLLATTINIPQPTRI